MRTRGRVCRAKDPCKELFSTLVLSRPHPGPSPKLSLHPEVWSHQGELMLLGILRQ